MSTGPGPGAVPSRLQTFFSDRFQNSVSQMPSAAPGSMFWPRYSAGSPPVISSSHDSGRGKLFVISFPESFEYFAAEISPVSVHARTRAPAATTMPMAARGRPRRKRGATQQADGDDEHDDQRPLHVVVGEAEVPVRHLRDREAEGVRVRDVRQRVVRADEDAGDGAGRDGERNPEEAWALEP